VFRPPPHQFSAWWRGQSDLAQKPRTRFGRPLVREQSSETTPAWQESPGLRLPATLDHFREGPPLSTARRLSRIDAQQQA
jgi:hypothetical protein